MGLIEPYVYKTKDGKKFWLHMKKRGKATLYYFSKDPVGALFNIPRGYEVTKNPRQELPMLKKKVGGLFSNLFKKSPPKTEQAQTK
jgi:hypothetical protein